MTKLILSEYITGTCDTCHHSFSFHSNGRSPCRASGCKCPIWAKEPTLTDVLTRIDRLEATVASLREDLAAVLGGILDRLP